MTRVLEELDPVLLTGAVVQYLLMQRLFVTLQCRAATNNENQLYLLGHSINHIKTFRNTELMVYPIFPTTSSCPLSMWGSYVPSPAGTFPPQQVPPSPINTERLHCHLALESPLGFYDYMLFSLTFLKEAFRKVF